MCTIQIGIRTEHLLLWDKRLKLNQTKHVAHIKTIIIMELFKPYDYLRRLSPNLYLIEILLSVPKGYKANLEVSFTDIVSTESITGRIKSATIRIKINKISPDPLNGVDGFHPMKPIGTEVLSRKEKLRLDEGGEITIIVSLDHQTYIGIPIEFQEKLKIRESIQSAIKVQGDLYTFIKKCKSSTIDQVFLQQNITEVDRLISESETAIKSVNESSIEDADYLRTIIQPITEAKDILGASPTPILQTTSSQDPADRRPPSPNDVANFNTKLEDFKRLLHSHRGIIPTYRLSKSIRRTKGADSEDRDV